MKWDKHDEWSRNDICVEDANSIITIGYVSGMNNPFDTSADVLGVNLLSELRHLQERNRCEGHQVVPEYLSTRKVDMHGNKNSTWKSFHGVRRYHEWVCAGKS